MSRSRRLSTIFEPPERIFSPPQDGEVIRCQDRYYTLGKEIGEGYFGKVFNCIDEWGNELVAKVLLPKNRTYDEVRRQWMDELTKLKKLRHPNITYIYDAFEYKDTFYLIIERCAYTLSDLFKLSELDGEQWVPHVARGVLQAVNFIHSHDYIHKDIHPGNIFIATMRTQHTHNTQAAFVFKVGDLGITRLESDMNVLNTMMARWMVPPESLDPQQFGTLSKQVDIYHAGLLLLSLYLGYLPKFSYEQIASGYPRQLAEGINSPFGGPIARALRRHVGSRTQSAIEFWRELLRAAHAS